MHIGPVTNNMVFTLRPFGHTLALWQRAMALVQFLVVQASFASVRSGVVKTFRYVTLVLPNEKPL